MSRKPKIDDEPLTTEDGEARELGDAFFAKARRGRPPLSPEERKTRVTMHLDREVVEHFKAGGRGWQTRINEVLARHAAHARRGQRKAG